MESFLKDAEEILEFGEANFKLSQVVADDIVDAMCLAVCAQHFKDEMKHIPDEIILDRNNIEMRIVMPDNKP